MYFFESTLFADTNSSPLGIHGVPEKDCILTSERLVIWSVSVPTTSSSMGSTWKSQYLFNFPYKS